MKKIHYDTVNGVCLTECPYKETGDYGRIIMVGSVNCTSFCRHSSKHNIILHYFYCNHIQPTNRNGANK